MKPVPEAEATEQRVSDGRAPDAVATSVGATFLTRDATLGPFDSGIGVPDAAGEQHGGHGETQGATAVAAGADGGISATALVWIGLAALFGAQLWDARRVRRCAVPKTPVRNTGGVT